jgi:hypothetical protein
MADRFRRWDWIEYTWRNPRSDHRVESRRVQENTLKNSGTLAKNERARLLSPLCLSSTEEAAAAGQSLCLVRPSDLEFTWRLKTTSELRDEANAYENALRNKHPDLFIDGGTLESEIQAFEPAAYEFHMSWRDQNGKDHRHACLDWETTATLHRHRAQYGEEQTLQILKTRYCEDYASRGIAFALGTVAARPKQWLLLGILRLDRLNQGELFQ